MSILDRLFHKYEEITDMSGFYAQLSHNKWMESLTHATTGLTLIGITVVSTAILDAFGALTNPISAAFVVLLSVLSAISIVSAWMKGLEARELERRSVTEFLERHPEQSDIFEDKSGPRRIKRKLKGNPWFYAPLAITVTYLILELLL